MTNNEAIKILSNFDSQVTAKAEGAYQTNNGKEACELGVKALKTENIRKYDFEKRSKELYDASLPLLEFMNKYYSPMDTAILTEGRVEIVCGDIGVPLPVRD